MTDFQILVLVVSLSYIAFVAAVFLTLDLIARKKIRDILEAGPTYTREDFERKFALFEATSEAWEGMAARVYLDLEAGEVRTEWVRKRPEEEQE